MQFPEFLSDVLRRLRITLGLTQQQVALRAGVSAARVSDFERGERMPTALQIERLAEALEVEPSRLTAPTDWLTAVEQTHVRDVSARAYSDFGRKRKFTARRSRPMALCLKTAMGRYLDVTRALLSTVALRADASTQMRLLARMPVDSSIEALIHLVLLALGAEIILVAPQLAGFCQHPLVHPETRSTVGHIEVPAYYLRFDELRFLFIPQVGVACRKATWVLDFLVGVGGPGAKVVWLDLEVDGVGHDFTSDRYRTDDIRMITLRISDSDVLSGHMHDVLLERILSAIPQGRLAA